MNSKGYGRKRSRHYFSIFLDGPRGTTKNFSQDSHCLGRDLNSGLPEYEAEVLTTWPQCLVETSGSLHLIFPNMFLTEVIYFNSGSNQMLVLKTETYKGTGVILFEFFHTLNLLSCLRQYIAKLYVLEISVKRAFKLNGLIVLECSECKWHGRRLTYYYD
jgi:hypothetical protein